MAAVTAAVVGAAVAVAGTAYTIKSSEDAKAEAKKEKKQQQVKADRLMKDAKAKEAQESAVTSAAKERDRRRQVQRTMGAQGRADTILTSPLGVQGGSAGAAPSGAGKTLLGT